MRPLSVIPAPRHAAASDASRSTPRPRVDGSRDEEFLQLLADYRTTGGLATGPEIAARPPEPGYLHLARMIAARRVLSFEWNDEFWLPVFQFEQGSQGVAATVQLLLGELTCALDEWELAQWFVEPNALLACRAPLALMDSDFASVHDAARSLRFTHCI